ncbi:MAG TPA: right-handed parallel beta-helix repeat-containing protein [Candidatus Dormibacteraeota bacterium]|nr:right-handed parallel beta-helix repeat-containing protein [Candidatus Dormibacteraeota bacterium]
MTFRHQHPRTWFCAVLLVVAPCSLTIYAGQATAHIGTTYYVDSNSGNDGSAGTSSTSPWKTIAKVNAITFHPGDRILFKSGDSWTGQLWPKGSGTAELPITIDKYGGDALPIINGAGLAEDAVLLKNQEYWEVRNLEVTNTGTTPDKRRGVDVVAENVGELHHIYLQDLKVHDVNGSLKEKANGGIHYRSIGDAKPSRFVDLRIENNHIWHVDRSGIFGWSTHWTRSKWYPSLGLIIRGNTVDDTGGDGIVNVATDGALVEYNVVSRASQRSQEYNVGIWPWSADNTVIQYNEVYGTRGQHDSFGFDSDWNSRNTIIQYNYSHDNEGGFLLICNEGSQSPNDSAGNVGTIVRYNISQNDHHRSIKLSGPVKNTTIYNNTIYVGKDESVDLVLHTDWTGWASDTYFYNNIFYVEGKAQFGYGVKGNEDGSYVSAPGPGKSSNNVYDFNLYYGVAPADDGHALASDPLLVNPGHAGVGRQTLAGYALQSHSPAVNSAKRIESNGGKDFFGTVVPQCGSADRGAAELKECSSAR